MKQGIKGSRAPHGTIGRYKRWQCRCTDCTLANFRYHKRLALDPPKKVDATGTRRRIHALQALGWSASAIGRELGVTGPAVQRFGRKATLLRESADRVAEVYERLSMSTPPAATGPERSATQRAKNWAAKHGWAPPLAWDDIDDLDEKPNLGGKSATRGADIDEWLFLVRGGEDPHRAAERLGVQVDAIAQKALRSGRTDVSSLAWSAAQQVKNARAREAAKKKANAA